jgi:hypothetical protein
MNRSLDLGDLEGIWIGGFFVKSSRLSRILEK